jgi:ABC-2 type transport system ATP-binding protein
MILKITDLLKKYGSLTAVDHLNLEVEKGEIFGLLGPNGSGKTTTIHCILALLQYETGSIEIFGKPMAPDAYDIKQDIGIIMQNVAVFDELTVFENIDYFCGLYIKDKVKRKSLVEEAIDFVELNEFRKFYPKKLSGGLLRRLNIACGIAHKPKLIILDEPTVGVDPQSRNKILEGIQTLNRQGATIIYTSHYMEEVERICTRIAIMENGKVIALGTKEELKAGIELGERITLDILDLSSAIEGEISKLPNVRKIDWNKDLIVIKYNKGENNLRNLLDFLQKNQLSYGRVFSESPTLNDVFLEITGKELRD